MRKAAGKVVDKLFKDISPTNSREKFNLARILASQPLFPVQANDNMMLEKALYWGQCDLAETLLNDPRVYPDAARLSDLFKYEGIISPRCIFALVQSKWFDPSIGGHLLIGHSYRYDIIRKFVSDIDLNITRPHVLQSTGFNPIKLPFSTVPDDRLLSTKLLKAIPQVLNSKDEGRFNELLQLDLDAISEENLNVMLVAAASAGNVKATWHLIAHGKATPSKFNHMAIRFAAAFGHFQLAEELLDGSSVELGSTPKQFIYKVFRSVYRECFRKNTTVDDEGDVFTNIKAFQSLFDFPGASQWAKDNDCQRMKLHFDYAVKPKKTLAEFFEERASKLVGVAQNLNSFSAGEICLLQVYGTFIKNIFLQLLYTLKVVDRNCGAYSYAMGFHGILKGAGLLIEPKTYEFKDPEKTFSRLFHRHYDRMKAAGASREDATEYAKKRIDKDLYHTKRAQLDAFDNATEESTSVLAKRNAIKAPTKPASLAYQELISKFGNWLCCLDEDFSGFAWGIEHLPKDIDEILRERLKHHSRKQAFMNLKTEHPGYIMHYYALDWKQVHGFRPVSETGDGSVVTVLDGFVNCQIPRLLAPSVLNSLMKRSPSGSIKHGIQVASTISHPHFGISPKIHLRLVHNLLLDQFYPIDLLPDNLTSIEQIADALDRIAFKLPSPFMTR